VALISAVLGRSLGAIFISPLLAYVIGVAGYFSHMPRAVMSFPDPGWSLIFGYYALLAGLMVLGYSRLKKPQAVLSDLAVVTNQEDAPLVENARA
jgi:hypothetical protein